MNVCLGTASQNTPVRKTSKFGQTLLFTDSPAFIYHNANKLLLHSRKKATLLLSINTYVCSLFKINPSDCELQIKETGVSADQYSEACDSLKI